MKWLDLILPIAQWLGELLKPLAIYFAGRSAGKSSATVDAQEKVIENHEHTENHIIEELDRSNSGPHTDSDINGVFDRWKAQRPSGDERKGS